MEFVIAYFIENALLSKTALENLFTFFYTRASRIENLFFRFSITHGISTDSFIYLFFFTLTHA